MKPKTMYMIAAAAGLFALSKSSSDKKQAQSMDEGYKRGFAGEIFMSSKAAGGKPPHSAALALGKYKQLRGTDPNVIAQYQEIMGLDRIGKYNDATTMAIAQAFEDEGGTVARAGNYDALQLHQKHIGLGRP